MAAIRWRLVGVMSDLLRDALRRIVAIADREPNCVNTRDAKEMEAVAREALAIEPEYEWRVAAGDSFDAMEDYTGWTPDEQDARQRVGSLDASPPYALQWLERRTKPGEAGKPERVQ